jgi:group I intron endonuclease
MKTSGIYRIDLGNNNFYIGSAVNLARRKNNHLSDLNRGVHRNSIVQNCWDKYGVFEFTITEECDTADLLVREQTYLDKHFDDPKNANLTPTAGSALGLKHSAEYRANMSELKMGHVVSDETRARISAANMGSVRSHETRTKMSLAQVARHAKMRLEKQLLKEVA